MSGRRAFITPLDRYVASSYARIAGLSALAMAGIFYISTFLDLSDKVFRGQATWNMLWAYFWYATPQYVYYILPLAVLLRVQDLHVKAPGSQSVCTLFAGSD